MASMTASAGERLSLDQKSDTVSQNLLESINRLEAWLVRNDYQGYDTFDGLNARFVRPLTFKSRLLRTVLQQGVRRFPWNIRPLVGVRKSHSTKGMGFLARAYMRLHASTNDQKWAEEAEHALDWLIRHQSPGYNGACWGNHFDYQSRGFYLPKGAPTVVWTSLIGHAFLDGYEHFGKDQYLQVAISACKSVLTDLERIPDGDGACISYIPGQVCLVHNANTLGGSLLARTWSHTRNDEYLEVARKALQYTAQYQQPNGAWWYGEKENMHWVDNFHTGYVLDCFKFYLKATGDSRFDRQMQLGYAYWKQTFFLEDGTPRYYNHKSLPIDIQCCSQAIDTLVFFNDQDPANLSLAMRVADWTIQNMQDADGHFYYRRYNSWLVNKTPTLHWGQATMLCALSGLYQQMKKNARFA
jgi:hypothetical protein